MHRFSNALIIVAVVIAVAAFVVAINSHRAATALEQSLKARLVAYDQSQSLTDPEAIRAHYYHLGASFHAGSWGPEFVDKSIHIGFFFSRVTDDDLAGLTHLPEVESLSIVDCPFVSDRSLWYIAHLKNLKHLELSSLVITDAGLQQLPILPELKSLRITNCPISLPRGEGYKFPKLQRLDLEGSFPGRATLGDALAETPFLEYLNISYTSSHGGELGSIAKLVHLKDLNLDGLRIEDKHLNYLNQHKKLKSISLSGTWVTDQGLQTLGSIKSMRSIHARGTAITEEGIKKLHETRPDIDVWL